MKRLNGITTEQYELEVIECDCGFHMGLDATYMLQVGELLAVCPSCQAIIDSRAVCPDDDQETANATNDPKPHKVWYHWVSALTRKYSNLEPTLYEFATLQELIGFQEGVNQMEGWMGFVQFDHEPVMNTTTSTWEESDPYTEYGEHNCECEHADMKVVCPRDEEKGLSGCDSTNVAGPDHKGVYYCCDCGLFFKPQEPKSKDQQDDGGDLEEALQYLIDLSAGHLQDSDWTAVYDLLNRRGYAV